MKICFVCNEIKKLCDFYKHSQMPDGYLNKCKECTKKQAKGNRLKNVEYYKEYDKERYQKDPRVKERHKKYQQTDAGKKSMQKSRLKWLEKNKEKRQAHQKLNNAIRDKKMTKPDKCSRCDSKERIEGHHYDYNKPLDIEWLCRKCHVSEHRK